MLNMKQLRKSKDRGITQIDWLKSRHTFSFGDYFDPQHKSFESLRVINEDWIEGGKGFGSHPHKDMEIITYMVEGAIKHKDSTGVEGVIVPGEVQIMRAGLGVEHSEHNASPTETAHLVQIWIHPEAKGLKPSYDQANFSEPLTNGQWVLLCSKDGREKSLRIQQNVDLWAKRFEAGESMNWVFVEKPVSVWVQVVKGSLLVDGECLEAGDGIGLKSLTEVLLESKDKAEALFFVFKS
jgi:quercetin 2,3-dioxygenase